MEVFEAIETRHSYRGKYLPNPVPREDLKKIMEAGRGSTRSVRKKQGRKR